MILSRKNLIAMVGVSTLTGVLLLVSLFARDGRIEFPPLQTDDDVTLEQIAQPAAEKVDYSPIVAQELFSVERGKKPAPPKPAEPVVQAAVSITPQLSMLGSYPNEWPRLKLTGVFVQNGRYGAVIQGGDALPTSTGSKYDSVYFEGDAIGGGVLLGPIERDSVTLRKDTNGWKIYIGVEPPVVPKK